MAVKEGPLLDRHNPGVGRRLSRAVVTDRAPRSTGEVWSPEGSLGLFPMGKDLDPSGYGGTVSTC